MTTREQLRITLRVLNGCQARIIDTITALTEVDADTTEAQEMYEAFDKVMEVLSGMEDRPENQEILDQESTATWN